MRFLILLLVLFWIVLLLLRQLVAWGWRTLFTPVQNAQSRPETSAQGTKLARRLVRDPVCGVHIAEVLAVPLRISGDIVHFCSPACRDKYLAAGNAGETKAAANG